MIVLNSLTYVFARPHPRVNVKQDALAASDECGFQQPAIVGLTSIDEETIFGQIPDMVQFIDEMVEIYNTPQKLDQGLRWIRCLNGKSIQETNDGEQA